MNNLQVVIPDSWLCPGHHGVGHAYGKQRHTDIGQLFGLVVGRRNLHSPVLASLIPTITVIGRYFRTRRQPVASQRPGLFPDHRLCHERRRMAGVTDPNHVRNTFNVGAALIDQYDTDDLC